MDDHVPFIMVKGSGSKTVNYAVSRKEKLDMLYYERGGRIIAVWPGKWSSDAFLIDDRKLAIHILERNYHTLRDMLIFEHHAGRHAEPVSECYLCQNAEKRKANGAHQE